MNKTKSAYLAPVAETFVVRFEGCLCTSPGAPGDPLDNGNTIGFGDDDE